MYWGSKRELRTIQKRQFMKDTRWAFSVFGGVIPNDDFQIYVPLGGRIAYYFSEDIGAEISGAYSLRTETELRSFLKDQIEGQGGTSAEIFLTQTLDWYTTANILWSPFHGKMGAFTTKLFHFDFYVTLGAGVVGLTVDPPGAAGSSAEYKIAGNVGVGAMMYVLDFMAVRLDYRHFFHEFAGGGGGLSYPAEITAGVAFFTPAPK
jgi:outer membrane beta-barrel protein